MDSAVHSDRIEAERLQLLMRNGIYEMIGQIMCASAVVLLFHKVVDSRAVQVWFVAAMVVVLLRSSLCFLRRRGIRPIQGSRAALRIFAGGVGLQALTWMAALWLFFDPYSMDHQAVLACIVIALTSGVFSLLAPSRLATALFLIPVVGTLIARSLASDFTTMNIMAGLQLGYLPAALLAARQIGDGIIDNIRLRLDTERRERVLLESENLLRESEERYRRLFERGKDAMWVMRGHRFAIANDAACRILGYDTPEHFVNTHPAEISPPLQDDGEPSFEKAGRMMELAYKNGSNRFPWTHVRRDGHAFPAEVTLTHVGDEGEDTLFAVVRDVTDHRILEEELRRARVQAEEGSRAKSEFLATMSHEIRTPMNAVLGMADLLSSTPLTDEQGEYVETITSSGHSLLDLINDILDFSKIEAGRLELESAPVDLADTIEQVRRLLHPTAELKGIEIRTDCAELEGRRFLGDAARLRQVLVNLVGNAVKFTEVGHVEIAATACTTKDGSTELRLEIRDTGIGISAQAVSTLFDPFRQADESTTRRFGGSGLGLAITKSLVEAMEGRIGVDSHPGEGSTFWMEVRLEEGAVEKTVAKVATPSMGQLCGRILVVEDCPTNQRLATKMLGVMGLDVDVAQDGAEGVELYLDRSYDLVLMDLQMPVLDGYEATRQIREVQETKRCWRPIVAVTANVTPEDRRRCEDVGMDGFLSKPYNLTQLRQIVEAWLRQGATV